MRVREGYAGELDSVLVNQWRGYAVDMQESSCNEPVSVEANVIMNLREWRRYAGDMLGSEPERGIECYLSLVLSF